MKYKVKQSSQFELEKDLNDEAKKGYIWVCKLASWNTEWDGHTEKLFTYLLQKVQPIYPTFPPNGTAQPYTGDLPVSVTNC